VDCPVNTTEAPVEPATAPEIVVEPAVGTGVGAVAFVTVKVADVKCEYCGLRILWIDEP